MEKRAQTFSSSVFEKISGVVFSIARKDRAAYNMLRCLRNSLSQFQIPYRRPTETLSTPPAMVTDKRFGAEDEREE